MLKMLHSSVADVCLLILAAVGVPIAFMIDARFLALVLTVSAACSVAALVQDLRSGA